MVVIQKKRRRYFHFPTRLGIIKLRRVSLSSMDEFINKYKVYLPGEESLIDPKGNWYESSTLVLYRYLVIVLLSFFRQSVKRLSAFYLSFDGLPYGSMVIDGCQGKWLRLSRNGLIVVDCLFNDKDTGLWFCCKKDRYTIVRLTFPENCAHRLCLIVIFWDRWNILRLKGSVSGRTRHLSSRFA